MHTTDPLLRKSIVAHVDKTERTWEINGKERNYDRIEGSDENICALRQLIMIYEHKRCNLNNKDRP